MDKRPTVKRIDIQPPSPSTQQNNVPVSVKPPATPESKPSIQKNNPPPQPAQAGQPAPAPAKKRPTRKKLFGGINRETSEYIVESLSMLLQAGLTVGDSLQSIETEITDKKVKDTIAHMRVSVDEGMPFSKAIEKTGLFNASVVTLIEIGETTGNLSDNLRVVADQMHKNNQMSSRIKSAMLYPAFLVSLLFIVGTGIGVFLLPKLLTIINGLHEKVGPLTDALIFIGTYFGRYGLAFAGGVVVLGLAVAVGIKLNPKIRAFVENILYHTPGIKKLLFESEIARFGFIFGSLLDAGLPVVVALQSLSSSMSTQRYQRFAIDLCGNVDEGNSFSQVLTQPRYRKLLSGTICQIIISAEKSGNLSKSLQKIGENYQDKADITARNLETLLEPVVLVLIAVGVLFVALAVFLPIYSLVGQFNSTGT